jgi:hypothetical protein
MGRVKMKYLATTFSPSMLAPECEAVVKGADLDECPADFESAVGHEVTALILSALLKREVTFNRVNLVLESGDEMFCIIPGFRASEAREFSREEVVSKGFRCFNIRVL